MTGTSGVLFPDDFKLNIGTGSDLQIYHDGTHNYIDGITNDLYIRTVTPGDDVVVQAYDDLFLYVANGVDALIARGGGTVELYHNGAKKLETTSTGVTVTGDGTFTGSVIAGDNIVIGSGGTYQAGNIYSDANWGMIFRALQASPTNADFLFTNSADVERFRISSNGNAVFVGSVTSPTFLGDLNGTINTA
jgi:hypothetical protein